MSRNCGPGWWVEFERTDRDYITWSSTGLSGAATVFAELEEDGVLHAMAVNLGTGDITGYFAGPEHPAPSPAIVVTATSHIDLHISDGDIQRTIDGGFIRLLP